MRSRVVVLVAYSKCFHIRHPQENYIDGIQTLLEEQVPNITVRFCSFGSILFEENADFSKVSL